MSLQVGQFIQAGQSLATLVREPDAPAPSESSPDRINAQVAPGNSPGSTAPKVLQPLEAQLFAPSRTVGFIAPGQTVYLRYAAYPFQKFGLYPGRITAISATPFAASELPPNLARQLLSQAGSEEALYRINVRLDQQVVRAYGADHPLKAGLTLEADVVQDHRRIWEWVLELVLAAREQLRIMSAPSATPGV